MRRRCRDTQSRICPQKTFKLYSRIAKVGCGSEQTKVSRGLTEPSSSHLPSQDPRWNSFLARTCALSPKTKPGSSGLPQVMVFAGLPRAARMEVRCYGCANLAKFLSTKAVTSGPVVQKALRVSTAASLYRLLLRNQHTMVSELLPKTKAVLCGSPPLADYRSSKIKRSPHFSIGVNRAA